MQQRGPEESGSYVRNRPSPQQHRQHFQGRRPHWSELALTSGYSLASSTGVWQKSHLTCILDGRGNLALVLHRSSGDATSADLAAVRNELTQRCYVLVIDDLNLDGLDRCKL